MSHQSKLFAIAFHLAACSAWSAEEAYSELPPLEVSAKYFQLPTEELIRLAEGGDVEATVDLGWRYFVGDRVGADDTKAREWFERSAEKGSHRGMTRLAEWYLAANQTEQAIVWHEKAIAHGSAESLTGIGFLHFHGLGFEPDKVKALEFYQKAVALNDPDAHNNLGYFYQNGIQVVKDLEKARFHFEQAAEAGNAAAMNSLGQIYANGQGVAQDYGKAFKYFEDGSRRGFPGCEANLAILYLNGLGVEKDRVKGEALLVKSAASGNREAARALADIYYQGTLLDLDLRKSLEYYLKAARKGDTEAMLQVAWMLNKGEGTDTPDREAALQWADRAKELGHPMADSVRVRLKSPQANARE